jgi:hypothetical protein
MQFGAASPTPLATSPALSLANPFKPAPRAPFTLSPLTLQHYSRGTLLSPPPILIARLFARHRDNLCLDLRSYTVAPDSPGSDATHLTGSSTCQPAANFRLKDAITPHGDSDSIILR